ncbi:hypothetical protein Bca4012_024033 [Brassica carinata]|uniref:Uncharacterized protein n=1 Tax=Brassica carinata TaxID=52824 RepID=A0A8X7TFL4_BRACI|nr:hypothetical protein Bca52824_090141 [Brassica carinata]
METPLSTTRVAVSQAIFSTNNSDSLSKTEDSSFFQRKNINTQEHRSALIDITNDSPIVGLAMQTPPSGFVCKRQNSRIIKSTPGSGEALLRGQVKTLLEKVEEGTELAAHSIKSLPFIHLVTSPMRLLAPTPANTPHFPNFSDDKVQIKIASPVVAGHSRTSQVTLKGSEISGEKEEMSMSISRSLLLDFTDKSAALWEEEEEKEEVEKTRAEFAGKHSRFVYNSEDDDEIIEAKKVCY